MNQETRDQIEFVRWWDVAAVGYGLDPRLLHHSPNGGKRRKTEAAIFKGMGLRPGFPDMLLMVARGTKHALLIELKTPDGALSTAQKEMMKLHEEQGFCWAVCWSVNEAIGAVVNYLRSGNPFQK